MTLQMISPHLHASIGPDSPKQPTNFRKTQRQFHAQSRTRFPTGPSRPQDGKTDSIPSIIINTVPLQNTLALTHTIGEPKCKGAHDDRGVLRSGGAEPETRTVADQGAQREWGEEGTHRAGSAGAWAWRGRRVLVAKGGSSCSAC